MVSFLARHVEEVDLIIDITAGGVTISAVYFDSLAPVILYHEKITLMPQHKPQSETLENEMIRALKSVLERMSDEGLSKIKADGYSSKIKRVHCMLSSLWYISQSKTVRIEKDQAFVCTRRLLEDLVHDEQRSFIKSINATTLSLIESRISSVRLNGYKTNKPIARTAQSLELVVHMTAANKDLLDRLSKTIGVWFHADEILFHSFVSAALETAQSHPQTAENFLLLDIGGEISDINIVKKGILLESITLPYGRNHFIRSVANDLNTLPSVAHSFMSLFIAGKSEKSLEDKLEKALKKASDMWHAYFDQSLISISEEFFVPRTIFFSSSTDLLPFFKELLQADQFRQFSSEEVFTVIPLDFQHLFGQYMLSKGVKEDTSVIIETAFINSLRKKQDLANLIS